MKNFKSAKEYIEYLDVQSGEGWSNLTDELAQAMEDYARIYYKNQIKLMGVSREVIDEEIIKSLEGEDNYIINTLEKTGFVQSKIDEHTWWYEYSDFNDQIHYIAINLNDYSTYLGESKKFVNSHLFDPLNPSLVGSEIQTPTVTDIKDFNNIFKHITKRDLDFTKLKTNKALVAQCKCGATLAATIIYGGDPIDEDITLTFAKVDMNGGKIEIIDTDKRFVKLGRCTC